MISKSAQKELNKWAMLVKVPETPINDNVLVEIKLDEPNDPCTLQPRVLAVVYHLGYYITGLDRTPPADGAEGPAEESNAPGPSFECSPRLIRFWTSGDGQTLKILIPEEFSKWKKTSSTEVVRAR